MNTKEIALAVLEDTEQAIQDNLKLRGLAFSANYEPMLRNLLGDTIEQIIAAMLEQKNGGN